MPVVESLLVPKPAILAGGAPDSTGDYTWPVVLLVTTIVMLVFSARKGVRVFSFALTYTNQWFVFGTTGRVRVRVHSFTSATGSNCFTSGEFTAELVKDEDEKDQCGQSDNSSSRDEQCPGAEQSSCIVDTEMVFIYGTATSVFTAGNMSSVQSVVKTFGNRRLREGVFEANPSNLRAREARFEGQFRRPAEDGEDLRRRVVVPEWASSLLGPRQVVRVCILPLNSLRGKARAAAGAGDYAWDANMRVRLEGQRSCRQVLAREQKRHYPAAVLQGVTHTATLRKNVVKIWENPRRRVVMSMPIRKEDLISSLDVDWERNTALLGNSRGELSVWDLERMVCVSSVGTHCGSINDLHSKRSVKLEHDSWILLAGCQSIDECRERVRLWDSRALTSEGITACSLNSASLDNFEFAGMELVVRDDSNKLSVHDIRMVRPSPVISISADDVRIPRGVRTSTLDEDKWWDVGASDHVHDEDDFWEDSWVRVERADKMQAPSPRGVLSRCFSALSSVLSR